MRTIRALHPYVILHAFNISGDRMSRASGPVPVSFIRCRLPKSPSFQSTQRRSSATGWPITVTVPLENTCLEET